MPSAADCPIDYRAILNAVPGAYLLLDVAFTIVGVTDAYLAATMTTREGIVGQGLFEVFPDNPDDPAADGVRNLRASLLRVLAGKRPDRMPLQKYDIRRPERDGGGFEERHWSPLNTPVLDSAEEVCCIIHWVEDVTEFVRLQRRMQEDEGLLQEELRARATTIEAEVFLRVEAVAAYKRLAESERRYRFLADAVPQLVWTAGADGAVDYYNAAWFTYSGLTFEELHGGGWRRTVHPDDLEQTVTAWSEAVRTAPERYQVEHRLRRHDGTFRWMLTTALPFRDGSGGVLKWFGTTTDVHDRITAEERLRQAQRLQSVGQLAGGVAHEVNNMMSIVISAGHFALRDLGTDHPGRTEVEEMIKAAYRAAGVTHQLLAYGRRQALRPVVLDVNEVIRELAPTLERLIGSDRRLSVRPAAGSIRVRADQGQLGQVLINLVANARDATGTDSLIRLETGAVEFDRATPDPAVEGEINPGPFARIAVRDDGVGMAPDVAARAFEPFFTTKSPGEGTGLGLSMVYGIVKQSGGYVTIDSAPGGGTTVEVYLPCVAEEVSGPEDAPRTGPGQGECILVVEDEPAVRAIVRRVLHSYGYVVHEAPAGRAALDFMAAHSDEVDLVLTDVVMPTMNGREFADRLGERHPEVPVLFMSGYGGDDIQQRGLVLADAPFIRKPVTPEGLSAAVRELLDSTQRHRR